MDLILVRHGESLANSKGEHQGRDDGWSDTSLSERGKEQARKVAERLSIEDIGTLYSSPFKRAYETAREINKFHNLEINIDKRVAEKKDPEEREEFLERVKEFFKEISEKHKNDNLPVVLVAHGGIIRGIIGISAGDRKKGSRLARKTTQSNTAINKLEKEGEHYKIHAINSVDHLEPDKEVEKLFYEVQKIPFKFGEYDDKNKSEILKEKLLEKGYESKKGIVIFDWKDLPIPKKVMDVLENSNTKDLREVVGVKFNGGFLMLDPGWPPYLEEACFPVTKDWEGKEDTKQVTEGEIDFYKREEFEENREDILKEHGIDFDEDEYKKFKESLNEWFEEFRRS